MVVDLSTTTKKLKNLHTLLDKLCRHLFICAVCINYRLNLLHKGIIVVLVINSAEHWFAYNIAISVNKYSCWKCHDF